MYMFCVDTNKFNRLPSENKYPCHPISNKSVPSRQQRKLEQNKIIEHWDVIQEIPEKSANDNGMF